MKDSDKTVEGLIEEKIIDVKDKQLCFCPLCLGMSNNETYFRHMLTEVSAASRREALEDAKDIVLNNSVDIYEGNIAYFSGNTDKIVLDLIKLQKES